MDYSLAHCSVPLLADYKGFLLYLMLALANPVQAATANQKIWVLNQGKSSVAHYSTKFQLPAQDLD